MTTQEDITKSFQQVKTYIDKKATETEAKIPAVPTNLPQTYVKKAVSLEIADWKEKGSFLPKAGTHASPNVDSIVLTNIDVYAIDRWKIKLVSYTTYPYDPSQIREFIMDSPTVQDGEKIFTYYLSTGIFKLSVRTAYPTTLRFLYSPTDNSQADILFATNADDLKGGDYILTDADIKVNSAAKFVLDEANGKIAYNVGLKKTIGKEEGKLTFTADAMPTSVISGTLEIGETSTEGGAFVEGIIMPEPTIPTIPTKTSDLENDSGFITSSALPKSFPWTVKKSDLEDVGQSLYATYINTRLSLNYGQSFVQGAVKIGTSEERFTAYSGAMGDRTVTYASVFDISKAFGYTDGAKRVLLSIIPGSMVNEAKSKQAITEIGMSCFGIEFSALPSFELTIYNFGAYATPTLGRSLIGTLAAASWSSATVDDKTVYQQTIASEFFNGTPLNFTLYVNTKSKLSIVTVGSGSATIQCDTLPTEDIAYKGWLEYITAPALDADTNSPLYRVQNDGDRMTETEVDEKIAAYQPTTLKLTAPNGSVYVVTVDNSGELSATLES